MKKTATLTLLLAMALGATACGDDDATAAATEPDPTPTTTETTTEPTTTTEAPDDVPADQPADATIEVVAVDYGYDALPSTVAAGTRLALTNASEAEVHELVAFRLPESEQRSADELVALPQAELQALFAGPPAMVLVAPPAADGFAAVGDGTLTEPGRYLAFCAIPTGADPAEYLAAAAEGAGPPQVAGGPPHFAGGMYAEIVVE